MRKFEVNASEYYDGIDAYLKAVNLPASKTYDFITSRAACRSPMNELINGFQLHGKTILSIAPNLGHEEFWLHQAGCKLVFVDIDEQHTIEPYLVTLKQNSSAPSLSFFIGDVRDLSKSDLPHVDVVYISSFTVDELYKNFIRSRMQGRGWSLLFRLDYKLRRTAAIFALAYSTISLAGRH